MERNTVAALLVILILLIGAGVCSACWHDWSMREVREDQLVEKSVVVGYERAPPGKPIGYAVVWMGVFGMFSLATYLAVYDEDC